MFVCLHDCVESFFVIQWFVKVTIKNLNLFKRNIQLELFIYLIKKEELEEWFYCLSKENKAICNYCDEPN